MPSEVSCTSTWWSSLLCDGSNLSPFHTLHSIECILRSCILYIPLVKLLTVTSGIKIPYGRDLWKAMPPFLSVLVQTQTTQDLISLVVSFSVGTLTFLVYTYNVYTPLLKLHAFELLTCKLFQLFMEMTFNNLCYSI